MRLVATPSVVLSVVFIVGCGSASSDELSSSSGKGVEDGGSSSSAGGAVSFSSGGSGTGTAAGGEPGAAGGGSSAGGAVGQAGAGLGGAPGAGGSFATGGALGAGGFVAAGAPGAGGGAGGATDPGSGGAGSGGESTGAGGQGPIPSVRCGDVDCAPDEKCCVSDESHLCRPLGAACCSGAACTTTSVTCDGQEDCAVGTVCCANVSGALIATWVSSIKCQASCGNLLTQYLMCHSNGPAVCGGGTDCTPTLLVSGYECCQ